MLFISSGKLLGSDSISVDVHRFRNAFKATKNIQFLLPYNTLYLIVNIYYIYTW